MKNSKILTALTAISICTSTILALPTMGTGAYNFVNGETQKYLNDMVENYGYVEFDGDFLRLDAGMPYSAGFECFANPENGNVFFAEYFNDIISFDVTSLESKDTITQIVEKYIPNADIQAGETYFVADSSNRTIDTDIRGLYNELNENGLISSFEFSYDRAWINSGLQLGDLGFETDCPIIYGNWLDDINPLDSNYEWFAERLAQYDDSLEKLYSFENEIGNCTVEKITDEYNNKFVIITPNEELTFMEQLDLARSIYEKTGLTPVYSYDESGNSTSSSIDLYNAVEGDANNDGNTTLADVVSILQYVANSEKYDLTAQGYFHADIYDTGDGITAMDALEIQRMDSHTTE